MQQESSVVEETKAEADKCELHPKNLTVASSIGISKNQNRKLLSCALEENTGVPITCETIKYKAWKLVESHNI